MNPKNCQTVERYFNSEKTAKTIGRLAEKNTPEAGETVCGLLVKKGFTYQIVAPDDLHVFSQLSTTSINQRITVPYSGALSVLKHRLNKIYDSVNQDLDEEDPTIQTLLVHGCVTIKQYSEKHLSLHWTANPINDMVSDSIVAMVLNLSREMPRVVVTEPDVEENEKKVAKVIHTLLVSLFGDVKYGEGGKLVITVDNDVVYLDKRSGEIEGENEGLRERVKTAFRRIQSVVKPIPLLSSSGH